MIVYHGSLDIVEKPDVLHSYRPLDFGKGFYVTTNLKQAEQWAVRKTLIVGKGKPIYSGLIIKMRSRGAVVEELILKESTKV